MNDAHILIAAVSLGAAFGLGFWTGDDRKAEFWPNGPAAIFCVGVAVVFVTALVRLVMSAL